MTDNRIIELLNQNAVQLEGTAVPPGAIRDVVGDAKVVLIGESTHGTHDFYALRANISKWLFENAGFNAVAIEGDWPDAYRVNRYVRGIGGELEAVDALEGFERFPTWMWRNTDVLDFVGWLRDYNEQQESNALRAGFYGLDLYSLFTSAESVIRYLERIDPEQARYARTRYQCLAGFGPDAHSYARAMSYDIADSCEKEVIDQLIDLQTRRSTYLSLDGYAAEEEQFAAERNAIAVKNSERYYRTMMRGDVNSWNLRDSHMMATLKALIEHLERHGEPAKVILWAHNSHVGDARATDMKRRGQLNIGQLVREHYDRDSVSIGMSSFEGTVIAASNWDMPGIRMRLQPALAKSYEALFHAVEYPSFLVAMKDDVAGALAPKRLERAVGVVYRPGTERHSHYFDASLSQQFDAIIHVDHSRSLEPLERIPEHGLEEEPPETYPSGL